MFVGDKSYDMYYTSLYMYPGCMHNAVTTTVIRNIIMELFLCLYDVYKLLCYMSYLKLMTTGLTQGLINAGHLDKTLLPQTNQMVIKPWW
jgi:hypothetical protein